MGYPCKVCRGPWVHGFCQQDACPLSQAGGRCRKRDRRSRSRQQRKDRRDHGAAQPVSVADERAGEKTRPRRQRTSHSHSREDREDLWNKLDPDEYAAEERGGEYPFMNIGKRLSWPPRPRCEDVDEDEESEVEDDINEADYVWLSMETAFGIKRWDRVDMKGSDIRLGNRGVFRVGWRQQVAVCRMLRDMEEFRS